MKPPITYTVDDEQETTTEDYLTANQILASAEIDTSQYYLVLVRGQGQRQESYQDKGGEPIHMHPNLTFISVFIGSTTVS